MIVDSVLEWLQNVAVEQLFGVAIASTLFCAVGWGVLVCFRNQSASVRSCIWQTVGIAIVAAAIMLMLFRGIPLGIAGSSTQVATFLELEQDGENESRFPSRSNDFGASTEAAENGLAKNRDAVRTGEMKLSTIQKTNLDLEMVEMANGPTKPNIQELSRQRRSAFFRLLAAVWIFGAIVLLVRFMISLVRCRSIVWDASSEIPDHANVALRFAVKRMGVQSICVVNVLVSNEAQVPFTFGWLRPVIVLPIEFKNWSNEKLEMVFAHELAHVLRYDIAWHWILKLACCVAWFNPLVWLAASRNVIEREKACDDDVINSGAEPVNYGRSLVEIAAVMSGRNPVFSASVLMTEPPLKKRLHRILSPQCNRQTVPQSIRGLALIVFLVLASLFGVLRPFAPAELLAAAPMLQENQDEADSEIETAIQKPEDGWPVFRGNAKSSGVAISGLPDQLDVVWELKIPRGSFDGTPVIVNLSDGIPTVYIGDMDGKLYAIDLASGVKKWEYETPIGFSSSPAYRDGRIYIGDLAGVFYCVDTDGNLLWKFETGGEINSSANFYQGNVLFGSQDTRLYLLNAMTGELIWSQETEEQIRCSATVVGDRAFVAGCDGFFHVFDLAQGKPIGKVAIDSPTGSTPAVLGSRVFFGTEQADFLAVDWDTIKKDWSFSGENGSTPVRGSAAVTDGHAIFGGRNRNVQSLNPETGEENWATTLKAKIDSSPVIAGNRVFVGSTDGRFYGLDLSTGEIVWEKQFNGSFLGSPAVAFGRLVVATNRGTVICLGESAE